MDMSYEKILWTVSYRPPARAPNLCFTAFSFANMFFSYSPFESFASRLAPGTFTNRNTSTLPSPLPSAVAAPVATSAGG